METRHEENLCTAIFRRLNKIGFSEENVENEYIHLNFIMYFLNKILPSSYFSEENYELITSPKNIKVNFKDEKEILVIETVYEEDKCFLEISYGENTMCFGSAKNPINVFIADGRNSEIFKTDRTDGSFTYYFKTQKNDSAESEDLYCGKMIPINTCIDNKEYFVIERLYPKIIHQEGFLEKIKNRKHNRREKVIAIPKGNPDFTIYDDILSIFNEFQKEKHYIIKLQGKYARARNVQLLKEKKDENS